MFKLSLRSLAFTSLVAICTAFAPLPVMAQDTVTMPPNSFAGAPSGTGGLSEQQLRMIVDQTVRSQIAAGDPDATLYGQDGQSVSLSGALEGEDGPRVYRYEKPGLLRDSELPQRTFNNIRYPY